MLDFASFRTALGAHLGLDLHDRGPDTLLHDDLGFDSLVMAEISVLYADAGIDLPDELLTELRTLGDLHHYRCVLAAPNRRGDDGPAPTGTDR